jgi:hypothetical protein
MAEEGLDLDQELLTRCARLYEAYARSGSKEPSSEGTPVETRMLKASSFVIAAVYRSVVDSESSAKALFADAAREYLELGNPFHLALAVCAGDEGLVRIYVLSGQQRFLEPQARAVDPNDLLYGLLAAMSMFGSGVYDDYPTAELLPSLLDLGEELSPRPVGRLGLPLRLYLAVGRSIESTAFAYDRELTSLRRALSDYLRHVDESVGAAMNDRFHWRRLRSGLLPVEPEALAVCLAADRVSRRLADLAVDALVADAGLTEREQVPARIATRLSLRG